MPKAGTVAALSCALWLTLPAAALAGPPCGNWNTQAFFEAATAADVTRCLKAGDDPGVQGTGPKVLPESLWLLHDHEWTPLHYAAEFSTTPAVVKTLLDAGADLNARTSMRWTPLDLAAASNIPAVVEALLAAGADPNAGTSWGWTPLHKAATSNIPAVVEVLLNAGANPNAQAKPLSGNKQTPLHAAARWSEIPAVVAALSDGGADLEARDDHGRTPLHYAAQWGGTPAVVAALLDAGADPTAKDGKGRVPWELMADDSPLQSTEVGRRLKEALFCVDWNTLAFFEAAMAGDVVRCLKAGADLEARDDRGWTPLHRAAVKSKTPTVVAALLDAGANLEAQGGASGRTPLHAAAGLSKTPAVVTALLEAGADLEARDDHGATPLHHTAQWSESPAVVVALLDAGANLEARNKGGWTPLHYAARGSEAPAVVAALLDAGANLEARTEDGATPLHWAAAKSKTPAVVATLLEAGANLEARIEDDGWTPLHLAARWSGTPAVVAALLEAGADPTAKDASGRVPWELMADDSPLQNTEAGRHLKEAPSCADWNRQSFFEVAMAGDVVRCLKAGAGSETRDEDGATPLHAAARWSETPAVVTALLAAGADLEAQDHDRATPLHYAARWSETEAVVAALLGAGANPAAKDAEGRIPWDLIEDDSLLQGTAVYWRLNEGRFQ